MHTLQHSPPAHRSLNVPRGLANVDESMALAGPRKLTVFDMIDS